MTLEWLGHACFRLVSKAGTALVIDPYDDSTGYGSLHTRADAVITSHSHHDHAWLEAVTGYETVIDKPGKTVFRDVTIETVSAFHDDVQGAKRGKSLITKITADGETAVHLGDLGHEPDEAQYAFIRGASVLMLPVGGFFTIDTPMAVKICKNAACRAVVPMHFKTGGNEFPISTEAEFVKETGAVYLHKSVVEISGLSGAAVMDYTPNK